MLKLDNFILEEYDNYIHSDFLNKIQCDKDIQNYLGDLKFTISVIESRKDNNNVNHAYIAFYNNYPIGFISITYFHNSYQISYGILPEYRKQNLGALLLQEFSEAIFEKYPKVNELILRIKEENIGSRNVANLAGFEQVNKEVFSQRRK